MHCDMLKIQDGGAIVEKVNCLCADVKGVSFDIFMIFCNRKNTLIFFENAVNDISVSRGGMSPTPPPFIYNNH